jgi:hypothetical protein
MRQAIHIFRKDARHCWPYIAAVMALTAVNAWRSVHEAPTGTHILDVLIPFLTVWTWWLAAGSAVHGESLAGDRRFWITRPYSGMSLLAAKLLFLVAFLAVPVLFSDCVVLAASGFNPFLLIPGLLLRQCDFLAFLALPFVMAAFTRVTREFLVALILFWAACYAATFLLGPRVLGSLAESTHGDAPWLLCAAGFLLVAWHYASRRTGAFKAITITLGVLAPIVMASSIMIAGGTIPSPTRSDDARYRSIAIRFAPDPDHPNPVDAASRTKGLIGIPVTFAGWPSHLLVGQLAQASVLDRGRVAWSCTGYLDRSVTTGPDGRALVLFVADMLAPAGATAAAVDLRLSLDLHIFEPQEGATLVPGDGWTYLSGFGSIRLSEGPASTLLFRTALTTPRPEWRYSLGDPSLYPVDGEWSGAAAFANSPMLFQTSPVNSYRGTATTAGPVVFTAKRQVAVVHRELLIRQIHLADFETRIP